MFTNEIVYDIYHTYLPKKRDILAFLSLKTETIQ
ncbi:MAG: hypothetical protein RIT22_1962 [Bacteroidota bacterium]|jgi:hypothetical protein